MKTFWVLLKIAGIATYSSDNDRDRKRMKLSSEIEVEQENGVCVVFRSNSTEKNTYLRFELLTKLDAVRKKVSERFSAEQWRRLIEFHLREGELRETLECVRDCIFSNEAKNKETCSAIEELSLFDATAYVSATRSLSSVLQLAVELEYAKIEELYDKVLYKMCGMRLLVYTFLEITLRTQHKDSNKNADRAVTSFLEDISTDSQNLKEKYNKTKEVCDVKWRVDKNVLEKLFTKNRVMDQEERYRDYDFLDNNLENYKTLLRLRIIDYPEEETLYKNVLGVYVLEDYRRNTEKGNEADTTIVDVNINKVKREDTDILKCAWYRLTANEEADVNSVFCDGKDREVDVLTLENFVQTHATGSVKNKIVVSKYLVIDSVEGTIDFVDAEKVENVRIYSVRSVKFCRDNKEQVFTNTKVVTVESSSLGILLHEDGTQLFSNLEKLIIQKCTITSDVYKILTGSIRVVHVKNCNFSGDVTPESMREQVKCKNVFIERRTQSVFLTESPVAESHSELEDSTTTGHNDHKRQMQSLPMYFSDIIEMVRQTSERYENTRERIGTSIVKIGTEYRLHVNTVRSIAGKIVFLEVDSAEDYINMKKVCDMKSLRYLEVWRLEYKVERIESLKIEKHHLEVLILSNIKESKQEVLVKRLFDDELVCLDASFPENKETKKELLEYFVNLKVLSIAVEGGLFYEEYGVVLSRIHNLEKLEVLDTLLLKWNDYDSERIESFEAARSVLDKCKTLKRLVTVLCEYNMEIYKTLRQVITAQNNRRYKTSIELRCNRRNVSARATKEVILVNKEVQKVFERKSLVDEELNCSSLNKETKKNVEITYELVTQE